MDSSNASNGDRDPHAVTNHEEIRNKPIPEEPVQLCASCDRCRSRKTKCDGKRPCSNCAAKYMKKHRVESIEGVDMAEFECIYSPAKRRGPIPGRAAGQSRRVKEEALSAAAVEQQAAAMNVEAWSQPPQAAGMQSLLGNPNLAAAQLGGAPGAMDAILQQQALEAGALGGGDAALQQRLTLLQQLQQQQVGAPKVASEAAGLPSGLGGDGSEEPSARRVKTETTGQPKLGIPRTITKHTHLLEKNDPVGSRLRARYALSVDELFRLPPTPTDEEYVLRLNVPGLTPRMIPGRHLAALSAARFAEVALGAIVQNDVSLALELANAVVHCLRESVEEPVQAPVLFEVAKAYFLLGVFRACRGDMNRYFKYRRVCMTFLAKIDDDARSQTLIAAVSFLDSWAYMIYNANEKLLPNVDELLPRPNVQQVSVLSTPTEMKYGVKMDSCAIATNPSNSNWIQGAPPVYLNNEAPLHARSLDAIACAVRTCCDQANGRFASIAKEFDKEASKESVAQEIPQDTIHTPTTTAVLAHEDELCSRNMILSAYTLIQQNDSVDGTGGTSNEGQHVIISAMDAFLENSDEDGKSGFTDSQIQSLLSVCNSAIENPLVLHHAGPTYHMVTNAAVLLCHLMNGMQALKAADQFGPMEATLFQEVLDTYISVRKLLTIHRRKLPVKLRCHGIPRPRMEPEQDPTKPFVDLGETLLCPCRGCQGFVLMACSPCVAAERAREATTTLQVEVDREQEAVELGQLDRELDSLGAEFDLDDDALMSMIGTLIAS